MLNPIKCLNESFTRPIKAPMRCDFLQEKYRQITPWTPCIPGPWVEMNINSLNWLTQQRRSSSALNFQYTDGGTHGSFQLEIPPDCVSGLESNYAAYWVFIPPHGQSMAFNVSMKAWLWDVTPRLSPISRSPQVTPLLHPLCRMIQKTKQKTFCQTMPV